MKEKLHLLFCKLMKIAAEKVANEIIKKIFLFIFSSGIIGVLTHIITTQVIYLAQYSIIISISIASGVGYLITSLVLRKKEYDYRIIEKVYEYQYESLMKINFKKTFKIKALTKRCDRLLDRYNWTGSGVVVITSANKNYKIINMPRNDNYQRIEVNFGRTLKIGEVITVIINYTLHDPLKTAVPFLCSTITEPTEQQKLIVKAPINWALKDAIIDTRKSAEDHHTKNSGTIEFKNGECIWEISNTELHNVYSVKWDFENKIT